MKYFLVLLVGIAIGVIGLAAAEFGLYVLYKKYVVQGKQKASKSKLARVYSCKKDSKDERDYHYKDIKRLKVEQLPSSVDLRDKMSPVVDQGQLGSCTSNAMVSGLFEYLRLKAGNAMQQFSRLFHYYLERVAEGTVKEDSGAEIRDGMKVLQQTGVCPESVWPYVIAKFTKKPSKDAYAAADQYKISAYHRVDTLDDLKAALADGSPVVFGFNVYASFESDEVAKTGIVPMPADGEQLLGGHAVLAVGYDDAKGYLIVRNSWSQDWGDKGYFYMPYDVFNKLVMDMWTGQ